MKNLLKITFLILFLYQSNLYSNFTSSHFLKANGTVLRNNSGQGDIVNLRGTNLGSWLSMEYWVGPMGTGSLNRSQWEATAYATYSNCDVQNIFDRDLSSRWSNGEAQISDESQYLIVDMKENVLFNKILIETGDYSGDFARSYVVYLSEDGEEWEWVSSGEGDSDEINIQLSNVYYKRYVKVVQTGEAANNFWSIAEFNLFMEDDYSVRNSLILRFGEDGTDELLDYFQEVWITEADLDSISSLGMNMVRVPIFWMELMNNNGEIKEHAFDQIDWLIEQCSQREIYVILDLHGAPGGLNGFITSGQTYFNELWTDADYQEKTKEIWSAIATKYVNEPTVAAYDLLNEPLSSDQNNYPISWFYNELYQTVRAIDPNHVISVQAFPTFDYIESPTTYGWENVLYQVHNYNEDKESWDSQNGYIDALLLQLANYKYNWNVPILAGEFNFWNFPDLWAKYLKGLNELNISWSNWCYKTKRVDSPVENWGYFDANTNEIPDLHYDSIQEIKDKWDMFSTSYFNENESLKEIVSEYTDDDKASRPLESVIWLMGNNDLFVSSEGGDNPITCIRENYDGWETFTVVDAGEEKVALQGSDGRYLSIVDDESYLYFNSTELDSLQKFDFINVGDSLVAFRGFNGKYICSRNGESEMTCDIDEIGTWETFSWGYSSLAKSTILSNTSDDTENNIQVSVYPNPATSVLYIQADIENYYVKLISSSGKVIKKYSSCSLSTSIDLNGCPAGIYLLSINDEYLKKIMIE